MRIPKLAMTTLIAVISLTAAVSTASAAKISGSTQTIRVTWSSLELVGFGATVRCTVTLEGSFHSRTIEKAAGSLIGLVTATRVKHPCTGGTAWAHSGEANEVLGGTFANNLPGHITYEGFGGTLPNITSLRLLFSRGLFTVRAVFLGIPVLCEYITGEAGNATGTATRNTTTGVIDRLVASGRIRSATGGCPEGSFRSTAEDGTLTVLNSTAKDTITLI